ncbi:MAG TPA: TonB family protein [Deltaproteobacteria bacterium]|nr:TonB family protein [Deltaproteobacteria bacterium]
MSMRMILCLVLSALLHVLILVQPIMIMAKQVLSDRPSVPVRLVNIPPELMKPLEELIRQEEAPTSEEEEAQEGVSFVAEGGVAVGYLDRLKIRIFHIWEYPEDAIFKGEQGKVSITFVLDAQGDVIDIGVLKSSGSYSLDSAAMAAIEQAAPFGPLTGNNGQKTLKVTGHFAYVLD